MVGMDPSQNKKVNSYSASMDGLNKTTESSSKNAISKLANTILTALSNFTHLVSGGRFGRPSKAQQMPSNPNTLNADSTKLSSNARRTQQFASGVTPLGGHGNYGKIPTFNAQDANAGIYGKFSSIEDIVEDHDLAVDELPVIYIDKLPEKKQSSEQVNNQPVEVHPQPKLASKGIEVSPKEEKMLAALNEFPGFKDKFEQLNEALLKYNENPKDEGAKLALLRKRDDLKEFVGKLDKKHLSKNESALLRKILDVTRNDSQRAIDARKAQGAAAQTEWFGKYRGWKFVDLSNSEVKNTYAGEMSKLPHKIGTVDHYHQGVIDLNRSTVFIRNPNNTAETIVFPKDGLSESAKQGAYNQKLAARGLTSNQAMNLEFLMMQGVFEQPMTVFKTDDSLTSLNSEAKGCEITVMGDKVRLKYVNVMHVLSEDAKYVGAIPYSVEITVPIAEIDVPHGKLDLSHVEMKIGKGPEIKYPTDAAEDPDKANAYARQHLGKLMNYTQPNPK